MKKKWNLLPALALTLALVSCAAAPKEEAAYTVGICQLASTRPWTWPPKGLWTR